jgi:hypothetical protein
MARPGAPALPRGECPATRIRRDHARGYPAIQARPAPGMRVPYRHCRDQSWRARQRDARVIYPAERRVSYDVTTSEGNSITEPGDRSFPSRQGYGTPQGYGPPTGSSPSTAARPADHHLCGHGLQRGRDLWADRKGHVPMRVTRRLGNPQFYSITAPTCKRLVRAVAGQLPRGRLAACLHGRCLGVIDGKYLGQACRFQDAAGLTGWRG